MLWTRLRRLASRGAADEAARAAAARWPHLVRGWLDPNVPLSGWRTAVDAGDVADVLGAVAGASGGRLGASEVAEVLDALAQTASGRDRAFRFGPRGPHAFSQIWLGLRREEAGAVRVFLLADGPMAEAVEAAMSVGGFPAGEKRAEYELLRRFFVAAFQWQWTKAPASAALRAKASRGLDPAQMGERMERVVSDPHAALLEVLRGLRRRSRELLDETRDLTPAELEAADAFLVGRGAPTLGEMRARMAPAPDAGDAGEGRP